MHGKEGKERKGKERKGKERKGEKKSSLPNIQTHLDWQSVSGWEPSLQVSSCMHTEGSAPYENPAQMACSTSAYASFPRYCPLLMRMVGRMKTCEAQLIR